MGCPDNCQTDWLNGRGGVLVLGVGLIALKFWDFHFDFGAAIAVESFK